MDFAAAVTRMDSALTSVLGDAATVDGAAVKGFFGAEFAEVFGVGSTDPVFSMRHGDVAVQVGSVLVHASRTYRVRKIEPDGNGFDNLRLELP